MQAILHNRKTLLHENTTLLQAALSEILADKELRQKYYHEGVMHDINNMEQHLQESVDRVQFRHVNTKQSARVLLGATYGLFLLQILGDPLVRTEWDELTNSMTSILFEGLKPSNG